MASLPFASNASYWQYKDDTSYVLKWIDQTAKACGWKRQKTQQTMPAPPSLGSQNKSSNKDTSLPTNKPTGLQLAPTSGRLKGKDRKAAKKKAEEEAAAKLEREKREEAERGTVLSALEILEQANLISTRLPKSKSTGSISRPPPSVMHALRRAIKLRQSFSNWFETTCPNDHKSNSAHRYFIKVLEKIANLFLQATGRTIVNTDEADTIDANSDASREVKQNRYEVLLEQVAQGESEDGSGEPTESSRPALKVATTSGGKYHMEVKDSQENALMVFTLFTDLHEIKATIRGFWERCLMEDGDMGVATLLTAQALAFVQRSEEKVISVLDDAKYQQISEGSQELQSYYWSFPGTYSQLLNVLRDPNDIQAVLRFEESSHRLNQEEETVNMNSLTFSFCARRLSYTTKPQSLLFASPLLQLFPFHQHALLNSDIDKVLDRDRRLCRLLFGLARMEFIPKGEPLEGRKQRTRQNWSVKKDPIIDSLTPIWSTGEVNLTTVFAAEIMLDIEEVCSTFPVSKTSYDETYERYMSLLGLKKVHDASTGRPNLIHKRDSPLVRGFGLVGGYERASDIMVKFVCLLPDPANFREAHTNEEAQREEFEVPGACRDSLELFEVFDQLRGPLLLKYTKDEYQRCGLFDRVPLLPHVDYVFKHYPMFTTYRETFMQTVIESTGIMNLNVDKHGIGAMAHIYNSSRQLGIGNLRWPAMDRVIELHKVALFAGDFPTTPAAMLKSFAHRNWVPEGKMSRKAKERRMNRAVTVMKPSPMTQAFNQHYDTAGRIPYWYTLESNALAAAAKKKTGNKRVVPTNPSFAEIMPLMEEYLTKQLQDVRVDYLEIDRVGVDFNDDLLKHARRVFDKQADWILQPEDEDQCSGIDFVSESFEQEAQLHEAMAKCGGDPSKLPVQDCDYLQDSINCLANSIRAKGIGGNTAAVDGEEGVNMPTSLTRFRIRGSEDLPDLSQLDLLPHGGCCRRNRYF